MGRGGVRALVDEDGQAVTIVLSGQMGSLLEAALDGVPRSSRSGIGGDLGTRYAKLDLDLVQ